MKPVSISFPDLYLGTQIKHTKDRCGNNVFASSSNKYVKEALHTIYSRMDEHNISYNQKARAASSPFSNTKYSPNLDMMQVCSADYHTFPQQIIGIFRWMIELGRFDISTEVSLLS